MWLYGVVWGTLAAIRGVSAPQHSLRSLARLEGCDCPAQRNGEDSGVLAGFSVSRSWAMKRCELWDVNLGIS